MKLMPFVHQYGEQYVVAGYLIAASGFCYILINTRKFPLSLRQRLELSEEAFRGVHANNRLHLYCRGARKV